MVWRDATPSPHRTQFVSLFRRDPSLAVLLFTLSAALTGVSLLLTRDAFAKTPVYSEFLRLAIPQNWCGAVAIVDAALLGISVVWGAPGWRAFVAVGSAPVWFAFGSLMVAGGASSGLLSAGGLFNMVAAVFLAAAGGQWVHTLAPASQSPRTEERWPWI